MNGVTLASMLSTVQFVEAPTGRRLAVMDADDWIGLVGWLEEIEDQQVTLSRVRQDLKRAVLAYGTDPRPFDSKALSQ